MRLSSFLSRTLRAPAREVAKVQVTSNAERASNCMPSTSDVSRNIEELKTTHETEEIIDDLDADHFGVTLMGDDVVSVDEEQALEHRDGDSANSCSHSFWSTRRRQSFLVSLICVLAIAIGVTVVVLVVGNKDSTFPVNSPPFQNNSVDDAYLQQIRAILVPPQLWGEPNAPQLRAAEFMAFADSPNHVSVTSPRLQQRYALLVLYFSTGGEKWTMNPELHECDWTICVCSNRSVVTELYNQGEMTGQLPGEIGLLTNLKHLDLQQNRLEGEVPETLFGLTNLVELRLTSNMFASTISEHVGRLTNLETLHIHDNFFEGTLPESLNQLSHLKNFRIDVNWISGTILDTALHWPNLVDFRISDTFLTGTLPPGIGFLSNLRNFMAERTGIGGTLPSELGKLSSLEVLFISDSQLTGSIPTEFGNLAALEVLVLNQNSLTSTIPTEFGKLFKIESLFLSGNGLNGTIPSELGLLPIIKDLHLSVNRLTGLVPSELGMLTNLIVLHIHFCSLLGSVPSEICDLRPGFGRGELVTFVNSCNDVACAQPECCSECVNNLGNAFFLGFGIFFSSFSKQRTCGQSSGTRKAA